MRCRTRWVLALLLAACSVPVRASEPRETPHGVTTNRPNILFLFADDQRADTISAWGNPHIKTPNIDKLAASGFSFRSNYCFGGNSGAVCVPSRAMLMSGKTWFHVDTASLKGAKLLPELLAESGYVTFGTGKWHNGQPSWLRAFQQGRNIFFGGMSDHTKVPVRDLGPDGKLTELRTGAKFSSELFADAVIEFLRNHDGKKPFFAYVAFTTPHDPRMPPVPFREMYYQNLPPLPGNFLPQHPFDNGMMRGGRDENLAPWPRTEAIIRDQLAEYYGAITHMDGQIGRILEALKQTGQADNTLIIYAADQGLALGSHGLLGKQSMYEHSMRCPLIFTGLGIPQGKSTQAFSYLLDVFPTLCDLTGIQRPADLEGESLRPLWEGKKDRVRDSVFLPFMSIQRAVRDERWKLICYPKISHMQLFDLQADPDEKTNLIDRADHAQHVQRLVKLMGQWQAKVGDTLKLPTENKPPEAVDLTGQKRVPDQWQPEWIVKKYFQASTSASRPNVLFILCDDLRPDALGCYGSRHVETPHIDALASRGVRFANAFCTTSLCSPSRASILAGLYAHRHGVRDNFTELPAGLPQWPGRLREQGYTTAYVGKWHMGEDNDAPRPGFDWFVTHKGQGKYFDTEWNVNGQRRETPKGYYTHIVTDYALDWLKQRERGKPWALCLGHKAPHSFYFPEEKYAHVFDNIRVPYPASAFALDGKPEWIRQRLRTWHGIYGPLFEWRKSFPDDRPEAVKDFENMVHAYWGTVLSVDDSVGRLVTFLRASGQLDNTLIVFMGDNGLLEGEHGMVDKRTMHEPSIRIPLLACGPGLPTAKVVAQQVLTVDIAPSLLDLCGAPPIPDVQGQSWKSLVNGGDAAWRTAWFYEYNYEKQFPYTPNVRGIRTNQWKYIHYPPGDGTPDKHLPELYNLSDDPEERHNLAADPQSAPMRRRLERRLADLLTAAGLGGGKDKMPLDEGIKSELPDQKIR